ncbi:lipase member H isoform X1 [Hyalella azteca]|uniref:Lipase member H isoform X1 n=1 Tax=Hyalella azteca TaxID=294128 RepID=A0A979FJ70_HYAAZ|nr:lipase member H isoform X1 [Hyalella azteca]
MEGNRFIFFVAYVIRAVMGDNSWNPKLLQKVNDEQGPDCRPPYGCFPLAPPWVSADRPVALPPLPTHIVAPNFSFYSRTISEGMAIDEKNLTWLNGLALSPHLQVVFIAHGFIESGLTPWVGLMVKSLLRTQPLSKGLHRIEDNPEEEEAVVVVVVDWRVGAQSPYAQAVANARLVGAMTGHLIMRMQEVLSLNGSSFHLVGHSLGSHLMGYAGSYTSTFGDKPSLVGRITALDPAGPFFRNVDPLVRLDPSDAEYVDVIHTDSNEILPGIPMSLGNPDPLGHVDFYPNGGSQQPGCSSSLGEELVLNQRDLKTGLLDFMGCHHQRSVHYFLESIANACSFVAVECSSWENYQNGFCWDCTKNFCAYMGYHATPGRKVTANFRPTETINHTFSYESKNKNIETDVSITDSIEAFISAVKGAIFETEIQLTEVEHDPFLFPNDYPEAEAGNFSEYRFTDNFQEFINLTEELRRFRSRRDLTINHVVASAEKKLAYNTSPKTLYQQRLNSRATRSKKMFLATRHGSPFCGHQVRVTVRSSSSAASYRHGGEVLRLNIILRASSSSASFSMPSHGTMFLAPGSSRSIVTALDDIGRLQALVVEFAAPDDLLQSFLLWRFQSPVVHLSSLVVEFLATGEKIVYPVTPQELRMGEVRSLRPER